MLKVTGAARAQHVDDKVDELDLPPSMLSFQVMSASGALLKHRHHIDIDDDILKPKMTLYFKN